MIPSSDVCVTKGIEIAADLLDGRCDAIVGDLMTTFDGKCFQSCALGGDVLECGISDTAKKVNVCDVFCLEMLVNEIDDVFVSHLLLDFIAQEIVEV